MKIYMNVKELSEYINLSTSTIYKKTCASLIPYIKSGKKLLFKKEAIDEWLQENTHETLGDIKNNVVEILKPIKNQL